MMLSKTEENVKPYFVVNAYSIIGSNTKTIYGGKYYEGDYYYGENKVRYV